MKKLVSILLLATMLLTTAVALSACGHKCAFSTAWSTDAAAHWHACEDESCVEIADKADHTWNNGEITTEATQEADGVKTFTCTVCGYAKTEPVAFTGMTEDAWNAAFSADVFKNFTYNEDSKVSAPGVEVTTLATYKFTESAASMSATVAGQTQTQNVPAAELETVRTSLINSIKELTNFEDYRYDAETKSYVLDGTVHITSLGVDLDTSSLIFEDGKLVKLIYTCKATQNGIEMDVISTITLSDYGTTTIE